MWRSEPAPIQTRSWTRSSRGHQHLRDAGRRERRDASGLEARGGLNLLRPRNARVPRPGGRRDLVLVRPPVAGDERQHRAAVADEDEGLDDLRTRGADGLGRGAGGRRSLRELLDARVDAGPLEHLCDPRHGLRPALHGGNVARRNPTAPLAVQTPGDDTVERETIVNENERRALNEALFRDVNERIAESAENFEADKTEFVCECADSSCTERVPATLAEYEKVREEVDDLPPRSRPRRARHRAGRYGSGAASRSSRRCRRPCGGPSSGSTRAGARRQAEESSRPRARARARGRRRTPRRGAARRAPATAPSRPSAPSAPSRRAGCARRSCRRC